MLRIKIEQQVIRQSKSCILHHPRLLIHKRNHRVDPLIESVNVTEKNRFEIILEITCANGAEHVHHALEGRGER